MTDCEKCCDICRHFKKDLHERVTKFISDYEGRLNALEIRMKDFEHNYISLILKVTKEHLYEYDERICGLENIEAEKRLINLESSRFSHECLLQRQIDSLTEMYKEISLKHVKLIDCELNRKPHKCPVCGGLGLIQHFEKYKREDGSCLACEGKGIVWG